MTTTPLSTLWLKFTLESDATFGRGDGVAGMVDAEVQHDRYGLPYLGGKTLKGLLGAECAEILFSLEHILGSAEAYREWADTARRLFGSAGSRVEDRGSMHVGRATLPEDLRDALVDEFRLLESKYASNDAMREREWQRKRVANLEALTAMRRQTAMNPATGAPLRNALRTLRVVLRETPLVAQVDFDPALADGRAHGLLAACVAALRRTGTGRNRGRGKLKSAELFDRDLFDRQTGEATQVEPVTGPWLAEFEKEVRGAGAQVPH